MILEIIVFSPVSCSVICQKRTESSVQFYPQLILDRWYVQEYNKFVIRLTTYA